MSYKLSLADGTAKKAGDVVARKIFDARGNGGHVSLTETELSMIVAMTLDMAFNEATVTEVMPCK